jgi:hypothetical protein
MHDKTKEISKSYPPMTYCRHHAASSFARAAEDRHPEGWLARRSLGDVGYSNRVRGKRAKREAELGAPEATDVDVIDDAEYQPPRIPSKKWRELIKKVWEVDPLICPHCGAEMKLIALIDTGAA